MCLFYRQLNGGYKVDRITCLFLTDQMSISKYCGNDIPAKVKMGEKMDETTGWKKRV